MTAFRLILLEPAGSFRSELAAVIRRATGLPSLLLEERDALPALVHSLENSDAPYDAAIVSLDLSPNGNMVDVSRLCARFPLTSFVVYSASDRLSTAQHAHVSGAAGYFRRDSPPELILHVLGIVLGGEAFAIPDHLRSTQPAADQEHVRLCSHEPAPTA